MYNDATGLGLIRHVVVRDVDGRLMITIVINGKTLPHTNELIDALSAGFKQFSLFLNINERNDNVILTDEYVCIYGKKTTISSDLGIKFEIGPGSFMQVNDGVRRKLYQDALKAAQITPDTTVIDAYSGAGMLTAIFATKAKKAVGIEIVKEAVDCANDLKTRNGLDNKMENVNAPCETALPEVLRKVRSEGGDCVLVLDPPRQGVDEALIETIKESKPDRILYISCSPQTLARDVGLLTGTLVRDGEKLSKSDGNGVYVLSSVQPYDMFPQTKHIETLVCLVKAD